MNEKIQKQIEQQKLRKMEENKKKQLKKRNTIQKQDLVYKQLSSITDSYWKLDEKRKNRKGRTSLILRNPFVLDVKLNVISNYAYSVSDFFF